MATNETSTSGMSHETEDSATRDDYLGVLNQHNKELLFTLAVHRALHGANRNPTPGAGADTDENASQERERRARLEKAILASYEELRANGSSESEAVEALINNEANLTSLSEYLINQGEEIVNNEVPKVNLNDELFLLRNTAPGVIENLDNNELNHLKATLALDKLVREETGQPSLASEWKQKFADPKARQELLSKGLKYGGYGLTAVALVSTFPIGTPAILASKLLAKNKDFIASTASALANRTAQTLVDFGVLNPETVNATKENLQKLDEKTRSNKFLNFGRKAFGIGLIAVAAGSLGLYSSSMGLGELSETFSSDADLLNDNNDSLPESEPDTTNSTSAPSLNAETESSHSPDTHPASDSHTGNSINDVSENELQPDATPTGADEAAPEPPSEAVSEGAHPEGGDDLSSSESGAAGAYGDAERLIKEVGVLDLQQQRLFMDVMHDLADIQGIEHHDVNPREVLSSLPPADIEKLQAIIGGQEHNLDKVAEVAEATSTSMESISVVAQEGDTLSEMLAEQLREQGIPFNGETLYGDGNTPGLIELVANANPGITDPDIISVGQEIFIPGELFQELTPTEPSTEFVQSHTEASSSDLLFHVGGLEIEHQRLFVESLHSSAAEHGLSTAGLSNQELINQLPKEEVQKLAALVYEGEPPISNTHNLNEEELAGAGENSLEHDASETTAESLLHHVGSLDLNAQRLFAESLQAVATEQGISLTDYSHEEALNALPQDQVALLADIAGYPSPSEEISTSTESMPEQSSPEADSLLYHVGSLALEEQRLFLESLHASAAEHGIRVGDTTSQELLNALPDAEVSKLAELVNFTDAGVPENSVADASLTPTGLNTEAAINLIQSLPEGPRYEVVSLLREQAHIHGIDFMNTPPEFLFSQLPMEAKLEIARSLAEYSGQESSLLQAGANIEASHSDPHTQLPENTTVGGWLGGKLRSLTAWAKDSLGVSSDTTVADNTAAISNSNDTYTTESPTSSVTNAAALSMIAKRIESEEGYKQPDYPDVLQSPKSSTPSNVSQDHSIQKSSYEPHALQHEQKGRKSLSKSPGL